MKMSCFSLQTSRHTAFRQDIRNGPQVGSEVDQCRRLNNLSSKTRPGGLVAMTVALGVNTQTFLGIYLEEAPR